MPPVCDPPLPPPIEVTVENDEFVPERAATDADPAPPAPTTTEYACELIVKDELVK